MNSKGVSCASPSRKRVQASDQVQQEREARGEAEGASPRRAGFSASRATRRNSIMSSRTPPAMCAASSSDQRDFGGFHERLLGPAQERFEPRFALQRLRERPEVQRQEERERDARHAMDDERPVRGMAARAEIVSHAACDHRVDRAPAPRARATTPSASIAISRLRPRQRDRFRQHVAQADRRVHRDRGDEERVERRPDDAAAACAPRISAAVRPLRTA